jgi:hypothetical protein
VGTVLVAHVALVLAWLILDGVLKEARADRGGPWLAWLILEVVVLLMGPGSWLLVLDLELSQ